MKRLLFALRIARLVYDSYSLGYILEALKERYPIAETLDLYLNLTEKSVQITTSTFEDPYEIRVVFTLGE